MEIARLVLDDGMFFVIIDREYYKECKKLKWILTGNTVKSKSQSITLQRYIWVNCMKKDVPYGEVVYHFNEANKFDYRSFNIATFRKGGMRYQGGNQNFMDWWSDLKMSHAAKEEEASSLRPQPSSNHPR